MIQVTLMKVMVLCMVVNAALAMMIQNPKVEKETEAMKQRKMQVAAFLKNAEVLLSKTGKNDTLAVLLSAGKGDKHYSSRFSSGDQKSASSEGRSSRSPLLSRLLQEQQEQPSGFQLAYAPEVATHTQAIFPQMVYYQAPASATSSHGEGSYHEEDPHSDAEAKYEYAYKVRDDHEGNNYGHKENRDGGKTWGEYFVHMPDGRMKTVRYWADHTGYHAQVEYKGEAVHPAPAAPSHGHEEYH